MSDGTTRETFAIRVLSHSLIHAPGSYRNILAMVGWAQAEGSLADYNPLATTLKRPGSTDFNSVGVQNYTSSAQGVYATALTLIQNNFIPIVSSLQASHDAATTWSVIGNSNWGTFKNGAPGGLTFPQYAQEVMDNWAKESQILV